MSFALPLPYIAVAMPFVVVLALVIALVALFMNLSLRRRIARLLLGRSGSIEDSIAMLVREHKEFIEFRSELEKYLKLAELRLRGSIQGVGLVRFNPFGENNTSGNQSFALAFVDERGHGVVFSTLYARDRVGVYAKPIEGGTSTRELSTEESEALKEALEHVAAHKKRTN
jgi:hypothetical protein